MVSRLALAGLLLAALFPQAASVEPRPSRGAHTIAVVRASVPLRSKPNGRVLATAPRIRSSAVRAC